MNKKLIIVTTDMEIEFVMFVDAVKIKEVKNIIEYARQKHYEQGDGLNLLDITSSLMKDHKIDFDLIDFEDI